ncbi:hypothetical protein CEE45_12150 [Candidatus Heimdallarchaeota archaeon B3_Heim]|nr:MAG: hypothetical protein CEE45_12150 [Candidatus Heimdallarchaeota archaeon B3_Heim]
MISLFFDAHKRNIEVKFFPVGMDKTFSRLDFQRVNKENSFCVTIITKPFLCGLKDNSLTIG